MIKINDKYSIGADSMNIILFQTNTSAGKSRDPKRNSVGREYRVAIGYFSTSKGALDYMVKREIYGTGMKDFQTIVQKIEELHQIISRLKEQPLPRL